MTKSEREAEIQATVEGLPQDPPKEAVEQARPREEVLLYRSKRIYVPLEEQTRKMALVTCTACGESTYLEQVNFSADDPRNIDKKDKIGFIDPVDQDPKKTGSTCLCPACGKGCQALHVGRFKYEHVVGVHDILTVHAVKGHLALLFWRIEKVVKKDGRALIRTRKLDGIVIVSGKMVRLAGYMRNMDGGIIFFEQWKRREKFEDRIGELLSGEIEEGSLKQLYLTDCEKSGLDDFIRNNERFCPVNYLQLWMKYPQVENLVKQGFSRYVEQAIEKCRTSGGYGYDSHYFLSLEQTKKYINWNEVKPHRMLGIEKDELWLAKEYSIETMRLYIDMKNRGIRLTKQQVGLLEWLHPTEIRLFFSKPYHGYRVPIVHLLNYLGKQRQAESNRSTNLINLRYLLDYWDSVNKVYGKMEVSLLYPKNLIAAHDNMILRVKEKESAELNEQMKLRWNERKHLSFRDEKMGLMIFPCKTHGDLIEEGKQLKHCVAGYANAHARGDTTICFIRKIAEPEKPFYTLEYKNGEVVQNRGLQNCATTKEVKDFEEEWLEYLKDLQEKERKKNGKPKSDCRGNAERSCA